MSGSIWLKIAVFASYPAASSSVHVPKNASKSWYRRGVADCGRTPEFEQAHYECIDAQRLFRRLLLERGQYRLFQPANTDVSHIIAPCRRFDDNSLAAGPVK